STRRRFGSLPVRGDRPADVSMSRDRRAGLLQPSLARPDRPWRYATQHHLVRQSWPRRIADIGTIRLAHRAPFQQECDTDANQNDCPHDSHVEIPDASFDQRRGDSGDCEQWAGDSTMECSVTPEVDEARGAERTEKQCVSERLECGPNGSNKQAGAIDEHK